MDRKPYHGGNLWKAAEKYNITPQEFIDFSANINPLGPTSKAIEAVKNSLESIKYYPEPEAEKLRLVLAKYLEVPVDSILLGNGAAELIYMLGRYYDSKRIILLSPCFSEYGEGSILSPFKYIYLDSNDDYKINVDNLIAEIKKDDIIYIGNPNNPTAVLTPYENIMKIYKRCDDVGAVLIVDEAFIDFLDNEKEYTLRYEAVKKANLIVLGSLTKFFAVPGLRLGYLITSKENISNFNKLLPTWRINVLAQAAGIASLQDEVYIRKTKKYIGRERRFLFENLRKIKGLKCYNSNVNFILINSSETGKNVELLQDFLGSKGILVRRCDTYKNLNSFYFRIAVKSHKDNIKLLELLKKFFTIIY